MNMPTKSTSARHQVPGGPTEEERNAVNARYYEAIRTMPIIVSRRAGDAANASGYVYTVPYNGKAFFQIGHKGKKIISRAIAAAHARLGYQPNVYDFGDFVHRYILEPPRNFQEEVLGRQLNPVRNVK